MERSTKPWDDATLICIKRRKVKAFLITESFIREIIKSATVDDRVKHVLQRVVVSAASNLTQFVYEMFSYYMPAYERVEFEQYPFSDGREIKEMFEPLKRKFDQTFDTNIRVVDPFDALYNRSFPGTDTTFESYLMDVVYNNIEDSFGPDEANNCFADVVQLLEYIVITLEMSFINLSKRENDQTFKLFLSYSGNTITIFVH